MKRLFPILLACLCLTACHKATTTDSILAADDSIMTGCVNAYIKEYTAAHNMYYVNTAKPSDVSERLFEVWYDDGCYLVLVNRQDTAVSDFLERHPIMFIPDEDIDLTDSTVLIHDYESKYMTNGDTVVCEEYNYYVLYKYDNYSKAHNSSYDTLLIELSETRYLMADKFVWLSHKDTTIRHWNWKVKCYFKEPEYNEKLYWLYKQIKDGDSIPDEQLLDAMPQNREQFFIYEMHPSYDNRSLVIDSIAISRTKDNPLFRDAYINMFQWSVAYPVERIGEVLCPRFYYYDSVYFNDAIHRILPAEYSAYFEEDWYEWVRTHKEEIFSSQP